MEHGHAVSYPRIENVSGDLDSREPHINVSLESTIVHGTEKGLLLA